jgi:predicted P-loop ATPase
MDHPIKIAVCNRKTDRKYKNQEQIWRYIIERNRTPIRTSETAEEYPKLPKAQRDTLKDIGGYVCGWLKGGIRKNGNVISRTAGALDADNIPADTDFIGLVKSALADTAYFIYSTHSHTTDAPRYRIIVLFSREVSEDEYPALMRMVAKHIAGGPCDGLDYFDDSTYQANRMMYWASCPSNGEFVFEENAGKPLDPDKYLAMYDDWRDVSQWPTSSRQSEIIKREMKQQQDPLDKAGVIGAFCRAYSIHAAMEKFLGDVYESAAIEGRYSYIPADSAAGVVVYDDKWAYSHHASDLACEMLLNAFDLVRVHRFSNLEEKASVKAMTEFAVQDEAVSALLLEEHRQKAASDFADSADWAKRLTRNKAGDVENTLGNLLLILNNDEALGNIRFNRLAGQIYAEGLPWERIHPAWRDADTAQLVAYIDAQYGEFTARNYELALTKISDDRCYHPISDYLDKLPPWDETPRLDTLYIDYLGAEDTPYTRAVTRKTHVAAVARIKIPGVKFDSIPVINGNQGIGKSTLIAKLGQEWYSDSLSIADMKDKTAPEKLQGNWLLELSEMAGIKKMDVETVKSFASRIDDKYRPSYGRTVESHPRQCIIIGTTNNDGGFLRDVTGNRRFWPIRVTGDSAKRPWDLTEADVAQIWAEALARFKEGEELYLTGEIAALAAEEQRSALENDDREGLVAAYLDTLLPENWNEMDIYRRQEYFRSPDDPTNTKGTVRRMQVCNIEIWCECFGRARDAIKKSDSYEIEGILKSIGGWERYDLGKTGKKTIPIYGKQRIYLRADRTD